MNDHFLKKLRDMEITPSERANELFRGRMEQLSPQKKEKKVTPYFATAAAVLVALGFLLFLHLNNNVMKTDTAVVLPASAEETVQPATADESHEAGSLPAETEAPAIVEETPATASEDPVRFRATPERVLAAKTPVNKAMEENASPAPKKLLSDLQSLSPEIRYRYHSTDLTDFAILDSHVPIELEAREFPPVILTEEPLPLLARVVREVKYVANGEKPDLDRSGIKPAATVLAHNQNGLLANESRQIKEGIHKFKEIFR